MKQQIISIQTIEQQNSETVHNILFPKGISLILFINLILISIFWCSQPDSKYSQLSSLSRFYFVIK